MGGAGGGGARLEGQCGGGGVRPEVVGGGLAVGGWVPKVGGLRATHYKGCVSAAGLGKLLVDVVEQGMQMVRCGDLSLCNKPHLLSASSC